jgi:CelD/BcsL family acetyltransferase involved in cellulose biosynthesis
MIITILDGRQMNEDLIKTWRLVQQSNFDLVSPFFSPEFTLAVASARDDVRIAVIEDKGSIAGFFPFQVDANGFGKPVGSGICDYQGIICAPGFECDAANLLRACGLVAWDFDHLLVSQRCFSKFQHRIQASPLIDLSRGFAAYKQERSAAGSDLFKEIARKARRLEREAGELRFVMNDTSDAVFRRVFSWKSAQLARWGVGDLASQQWASNTLNVIRAASTPSFAGLLSVLYAGDVPIAGHFGMRSETIWHWWFTAYTPEYHNYSPGAILLSKIAEAASSIGISKIDLGKGQALYKNRFKNDEVLIAEGSIERGSFLKMKRKFRRGVRMLIENTVLEQPARELILALRRAR